MAKNGWIKIHRKMVDWEWYDDANVMRVFLHLLITANHKDKRWRGELVKAGQKVTSYTKLADELGLGEKQIRVALDKLESTGEVARKTTNRYTLITIEKYTDYQGGDSDEIEKVADKWQTNGRQEADKWHSNGIQVATNKNEKNEKNEKKLKDNMSTSSKSTGQDSTNDYRSVYDHYLTKDNLTDHRVYTKAMAESIKRAMKDLKITVEDCKLIIDRHSQIVEVTKDKGKYAVRKQNLDKLFGSTVHNGKTLKCAEYLDDGEKYLRYLAEGGNNGGDGKDKNRYGLPDEAYQSGVVIL